MLLECLQYPRDSRLLFVGLVHTAAGEAVRRGTYHMFPQSEKYEPSDEQFSIIGSAPIAVASCSDILPSHGPALKKTCCIPFVCSRSACMDSLM